MENYDIDTIVSLFRERGNQAIFLINGSEPDNFSPILNRFPILEKYNCFSISMNLKQGKNFKQILKDNQCTEKFSIDELNTVLNSEVTPTSAFIIFFNLLSFLYYSDNNDRKKSYPGLPFPLENEITLDLFILFTKSLNSLTLLQAHETHEQSDKDTNNINKTVLPSSFYDRLVFFFFKNLLLCSLNFFENDSQPDTDQVKEAVLLVISFFDTQKRLPATFFELFVSFIFKYKVHKFYDQVLNLIIKILKEKRPLMLKCDVSKIIEYINPYLLVFNQRSLEIIVSISKTYQTLSNSVIDCFSNLSLSLINTIIESSPKIVIEEEPEELTNVPYNVNDEILNQTDNIKELAFKFIETKSRFENGFICPQLSTNGIYFLLDKLDKELIEMVSRLIVSFMQLSDVFLNDFFNTFKKAVSKINPIYYFDALTIFYHFATSFQNGNFILKYKDFLLDPNLFNDRETIFTSLSVEKNAFRNAAFTILSDFPETIGSFILNSLNPLFRAELFLRIQNVTPFYLIFSDVMNVCFSLRNLDIKYHCEAIEKARCCGFCFLSSLFLGMFDSYDYFETVMLFCLEKNITNIFLNLFKESAITSKNFESLRNVFNFTTKVLNVSLEIAWKLIKITDFVFEKRGYLIIEMRNFFKLIMNYILKLNSNSPLSSEVKNIDKRLFKAVKMPLKYMKLFNSVNSKYIHLITKQISIHMSEKLYMFLLEKMGKNPKFSNKIDSFYIKFPVFIPIILLSCGLTNQIMSLFSSLTTFSIRNLCYFHDQQIDSILIQVLQKKKTIKYRNENFDDFYYDTSIPNETIKDFLFKISSCKTDYRIVSQFLKDDNFIPFVYSLLSNYHNHKLPILSIPTNTAESRIFLSSSHFKNDFSITFWINVDVNYLLLFPTENIDIITIQNGIYRFGIYIQGSKLRAYYANGTRRSDVTLAFFDTNKCHWSFVSTSYLNQKKKIQTFYREFPLNKSEFDEIVFDDENPISIKINSSIQKRVYNQKNNNYASFYSFKNNEFIGFIKDVSFYNRKLKPNEIINLFTRPNNNDIKPMACLSSTSDFVLNYQHSDNLFNVLRRNEIITKLTKILLKKNQKENICYCILNIISLLVDAIDIPFSSLLIFVSDENHFTFKGTFYCFYSIFENIKTDHQSRIKFFNSFISNAPIWCNYINFKNILLFYQTKLIIKNYDLLINNSGLNLFLYYFDLIDLKYWDDYVLFLKRILEKSSQNNIDQNSILCCIDRKYKQIKEDYNGLINYQKNLSYVNLEQLKIETSNITSFYPLIFQPENEIKKDENSLFRSKKHAEIHQNKFAASSSRKEKKKLKESGVFDVVPKDKQVDLMHDIPDEFKDYLMVEISMNVKQTQNQNKTIKINYNNNIYNDNDNKDVLSDEYRKYIIYMLDLIDFKSSLFDNNKNAISILFQLLKLKDLQITKHVLMTLYQISSEQPISSFTLISYNNLNRNFFNPIFDFLKGKIKEYPNFFPLICALAFSIKPQPECFQFLNDFDLLKMPTEAKDENKDETENDKTFFGFLSNPNSNNNDNSNNPNNKLNENKPVEFDPWYLFPIMLAFSLKEDELNLMYKILIRNSNKNKKTIERMVVIFHLMMNYFDNRNILARFFEILYGSFNEFLFDIIRSLAMILFAHPFISSNPCLTLLHLINNKSIISKSIEYEMGIRFYHEKKWDDSFLILLKLLDFVPNQPYENENYNQIILTLNSIFKSEIRSNNSFFEMSVTCDQLINDYKGIFEENFEEVFSILHDILQNDDKNLNKIQYCESFRKIVNDNNNNMEIINNQSEFMFKKRKRLSSQFDRCFRQMIYRNEEKFPKDIVIPEINCFLFNNSSESVTNIGIHYDQNGNKVRIMTPTSERYFDLFQDVNFSFKRKEDVFEIFTKFGKKYRLQFFGKHQKRDIVKGNISNKMLDDFVKKWSQCEITNFEFLMILNAFSDNIHQDKANFPSPFYKHSSIPDGKWSLFLINNKEKKQFVFKTKRLTLMPNFRLNYNQTSKKRGASLMTYEGHSSPRKSSNLKQFSSKDKSKKNNNDDDSICIDDLGSIEDICSIDVHGNNETSIAVNGSESSINNLSANKEVVNICIDNPVVPARYFYDFEIYHESSDINDNQDAENKENKNEFELLYNMRKCIENCTNIDDFADDYLGIQIRSIRKLNYRKMNSEIIKKDNSGTIIFAIPVNQISQSESSSFIAINSDFYVKYFTCSDQPEPKSSSLFLSNLNPSEITTSKRTGLYENSLSSFLSTNNFLPFSTSSFTSSPQSLSLNESDSFSLDNVNNKSKLFKLDDGIAAFDPKKKILIIFTTSSLDAISTSPSHLSLTSLNPFYSRNLNSTILVPLIFSTSIPEVYCKTYATAMADSIDLVCGDSERQFYIVSPTVVYSNNCFFTQFSSEVKILKVSKNFNIIVAATEDGKVHIRSSTSGKKVTTINVHEDDEISEIVITFNFGFVAIFMKSGSLLIYSINGTLIKSVKLEERYKSDNIHFWFTFDNIQGIDYIGFVTNDDKIFYFEAFYPASFVQMKSNEKFKNVLAVNYDKFSKCFLVLNNYCEIYVVSHNVLVVPINYNL